MRLHQNRRPVRKVVDLISLQRVLILRAGKCVPPTLTSCTDCRYSEAPGIFASLPRRRAITWSALSFAFALRLELHEHSRGIGAIAAAGERRDGVDRGILLHDLRQRPSSSAVIAEKEMSWSPWTNR